MTLSGHSTCSRHGPRTRGTYEQPAACWTRTTDRSEGWTGSLYDAPSGTSASRQMDDFGSLPNLRPLMLAAPGPRCPSVARGPPIGPLDVPGRRKPGQSGAVSVDGVDV